MMLEKGGDDAGVEGSEAWVYVSDCVSVGGGV